MKFRYLIFEKYQTNLENFSFNKLLRKVNENLWIDSEHLFKLIGLHILSQCMLFYNHF